MIAAVYTRQSLDKKDSLSIEAQIDMCKRICEINGWEYVVYTDRGYSGKNLSRPAFQQMLKDLKDKDIKKVIAYKLDRISRSLLDFLNLMNNLNELGVEFLSATENIDTSTPTGRAMNSVILTFAQLERENTVKRVTDNVNFRALSGQWIGGKVILGFDRTTYIDEHNKIANTLVENVEESKLVKYIFEEYLKPEMSVRKIAALLNEQGIKTKNGYTWDSSKISNILKNILYTKNHISIYNYFYNSGIKFNNTLNDFDNKRGLFIYNRLKGKVEQPIENQTLIVTHHKGFIDASVWIKVQEKLKSRKELAPRYGHSNITVLAGLVRCGHCGKVMRSSATTKNRNIPYRCFKCPNKSLSLCSAGCIQCDEIERIVEEELIKYCNNTNILSKLTPSDAIPEDLILEKEKYLAEINEIDSKIKKLINKLIDDDITEKYIREEINQLDKQKQLKLDYLTEIENKIQSQYSEEISLNNALAAVNTFRNFYSQLDFTEKKNILQTLIKAIYVTENEIKIDFFMVGSESLSFGVHSICSQHQTTSIIVSYNLLLESDFNFNVFSEVIKYERKKRKMTRKQFAELIGTNYRNIQTWEYENKIPKKTWLLKVEKALELDLSRFKNKKTLI